MTYRSKRRDEPRRLRPRATLVHDPKQDRNPPGSISYARDAPPLSETLQRGVHANRRILNQELGEELKRLEAALDDAYAYSTEHVPLMDVVPELQPNEVWQVVVPCYHSALFSLATAVFLTKTGFYGPGHSLMRLAFEALIIGKFCSVAPQSDVYDRWVDGVDLYFSNSVLKKIKKPELAETRILWKRLCQNSHATIWSGQPDLQLVDSLEDARYNLTVIGILLRWLSHLHVGHIVTPSVAYYGRRYRRTERSESARRGLRAFWTWQQRSLSRAGKALIREYVGRWQVSA